MKKVLSILLALFMSISLLSGVSFAAEIVKSGTCGDNLIWTLDGAGTLTISGEGAMTDYWSISSVPWYSIRDSIETVIIGNSVTSIDDYAFYNNKSLTKATIGDAVTSVGSHTFYYCEKLESVTLGKSVNTISDYVFYKCRSLTSVVIPDGVITIGQNAFDWCQSLESVTLGKNLKTIGEDAFNTCKVLKSIVIPDSVTEIGALAFSNCYALERAVVGTGVTALDQTFNNCHGLTEVTIGENVKTIGNFTFSNCSDLEAIAIPDCVTTIGNHAFYNCTALTDVYYNRARTEWDKISVGSAGNESLTSATIHFAETEAPEIKISTLNGAQVRTEGKQGLRFVSTLEKTGEFEDITEYGTILIPTLDIENADEFVIGAKLNGHTVAKVPAVCRYAEDDAKITFTAVITDIKQKNYTRAYSARAYAILDDGSVIYSDVIASRDVYMIASTLLSNSEVTLDENTTAFLQSVVRYVDGITVALGSDGPLEHA